MQRYSSRPFPPYRYVPGKAPHPTRDPQGHSYNQTMQVLEAFEIQHWPSCEEYLYGIDLFNHGYWWEAHEALEAVWVAAGRSTETGQFIQGLILVAVAQLKAHQGFDDVARRMVDDGLDRMHLIKGRFLGIDVDRFRADVKTFQRGNVQTPVNIVLES